MGTISRSLSSILNIFFCIMKTSFALTSLAVASFAMASSEVVFRIQKFDGTKIGFLNTIKSGDNTYLGVSAQSQRFDFDHGVVSSKVNGKESKMGIDNNLLVFGPNAIPQGFWLFGDGLAPHTFWLCPGSIDGRSAQVDKAIFGLMNSDKPDPRCEQIYLNREACNLVIPLTTTDVTIDCLTSTTSSWTNGTLTKPVTYTSYTTFCPEPTVVTITTCDVEQCYPKAVTITTATTLTCNYCVAPSTSPSTTSTITSTTLLTKALASKSAAPANSSKPTSAPTAASPKAPENKPEAKTESKPTLTVKNNAAANSLGCAVLVAVGAYLL